MAVKAPSVEELLKAGVHFGHNEARWHPKMEPYIYTTRGRTHIIHLEKTRELLEVALEYIERVTSSGGVVLFLGTKRQVRDSISKYAQECGAPYITGKWIGGLLTNWPTVSQKIKKLRKLKEQRERGELAKYTKREQLMFEREIEKLTDEVGGVELLFKLPDALFIVDLKEEKTAVKEATRMNIPIIAMVDTNVNPDYAQYPIPANDDAVKSLDLIIGSIASAVKEGKKKSEKSEHKEIAQSAVEESQVQVPVEETDTVQDIPPQVDSPLVEENK